MWGLFAVLSADATVWSWAAFGVTVLLRLAVALVVGKSLLHDSSVVKNLWLLPLRDLLAAAIWLASFAGHTVTWRGDRFHLKNGHLTRIAD
jgi:ceramide glucosyltransferase